MSDMPRLAKWWGMDQQSYDTASLRDAGFPAKERAKRRAVGKRQRTARRDAR